MKEESVSPMNNQPEPPADLSVERLFGQHPRNWRENLYVYPVVSRRSEGVSIGVNLNPDMACNFDCIYCQVDRTVTPRVRRVDLNRLIAELDAMIRLAQDGALFSQPPFDDVPTKLRRVRDIAFSGDGEPTASPQFPAAVNVAADLRKRYELSDVKIRVITNATLLARPAVRSALAVLDDNNGEIWAKLDAGTEDYFQLICRPHVPLATILTNILDAARVRPIVIQSLWMNVHNQPPPDAEIDAYADRLREIIAQGGRIKLVQIYTTARMPAESYVTPLSAAQLEAIAECVRTRVDVPIRAY
jgi:wyosine [tRNA(Phe)-imidazoG37] synthetase (radical SAM superfamily)